MASIQVSNLCKTFASGQYAVNDSSFDVRDGEFIFLLGPSGCGKSTTLRMMAGLELPTSGSIRIDGRDVTYLRPSQRNIGMVFERLALYPHLSVYDNLAFPLQVRKWSKQQIDQKIIEVARIIKIDDILGRRPQQLSGGQSQRVAIGRMLVRQANVFLMDEPISHLDAKLRALMRMELKHLQKTLGTTTLYVSHDQLEAMTMADRIIVMKDGVIQQIDTPQRVFDAPANLFVASFVGEPHMNILSCALRCDGAKQSLQGDGFCIEVGTRWLDTARLAGHDLGDLRVGVRAEHIHIGHVGGAHGCGGVPARVFAVEPMGAENLYTLRLGASTVRVRAPTYETAFIDARAGHDTVVYFDLDRLHLFDGASGDAIVPARYSNLKGSEHEKQ